MSVHHSDTLPMSTLPFSSEVLKWQIKLLPVESCSWGYSLLLERASVLSECDYERFAVMGQ